VSEIRRELLAAELVCADHDTKAPRAAQWATMAQAVTRYLDRTIHETGLLVIELPQVYERRETDPNDLIDLAGVAGAIAHALHERTFEVAWSPVPRSWKGQIPKTVSEQRVLDFLTAAERARIPKLAKSALHNVMDALHLGIVYMQRHERLTLGTSTR
jgi:hypothetical protein